MTLFLGVYVASFFKSAQTQTPCNNVSVYSHGFGGGSHQEIKTFSVNKFDTSKNYSLAEAQALIGKQVRNLSSGNAKCPKDAGDCLSLYLGEMGKVVSVLPSVENTYLIEIQWEESARDYAPRFSGRVINGVAQEGAVEVDYSLKAEGAFVTRAGKEVSFEIVK